MLRAELAEVIAEKWVDALISNQVMDEEQGFSTHYQVINTEKCQNAMFFKKVQRQQESNPGPLSHEATVLTTSSEPLQLLTDWQ